MRQLNEEKIYRIIDANFNRAKEGLRVCEDICRFLWDDTERTKSFKKVRHELTGVVQTLSLGKLIESRNIEQDVGKGSLPPELKRKDTSDIFYANSQRIKESLRVIEEFSKLKNETSARKIKKLRYKIYALEKQIFEKL